MELLPACCPQAVGARWRPPMVAMPVSKRTGRVGAAVRRVRWDTYIVGLSAASAFLVPLGVWTRFSPTILNLGGDDSHLIFLAPGEWIGHFASDALDYRMQGYNPRTFSIPLAAVLWVVRSAHLNPEAVFLGAILCASYLGMWRLVREFTRDTGSTASAASALGASVFVLAPILAETQWRALLFRVMWQATLPWLALMAIWHQRSGRPIWAVVAAAIGALSAAAVDDVPTLIPGVMLLLLLLLLARVVGVFRLHRGRLFLFVGLGLAANAFWLVPVLANYPLHQGQVVSALSEDVRQNAVQTMTALSAYSNWRDVAALRLSQRLLEANSSTLAPIDQWSRQLGWIGTIPFLVGAMGSGLSFSPGGSRRRVALIGSGVIALLFLCFETVNIVPGGVSAMAFLTLRIPGWVAERNFYETFAIAFTAAASLWVGLGAYEIFRRLPPVLCGSFWLVGLLLLGVYDLPFLRGDEFYQPYQLGHSYNRVLDGLPLDYAAALQRIGTLPPGAVLTVPLSNPSWSVIPDPRGNGVYIGIWPVSILEGRSEYNGLDSFSSPSSADLEALATGDVSMGDMAALARLAGVLGVRYVLSYDGDLSAPEFRFAAAAPNPWLSSRERQEVANASQPIERFGRFELRELTSSLQWPSAYLLLDGRCPRPVVAAVNFGTLPPPSSRCVSPIRVFDESNQHVQLGVAASALDQTVVLMRPSSSLWRASAHCAGSRTPIKVSLKPYEIVGNAIHVYRNRETCPVVVDVDYGPQVAVTIGVLVTGLTAAVLALLCLIRTGPRTWRGSGRTRPCA